MKQHSTTWQDFTNLYELSKTLRFELKPMGKTKENLEKQNVLIHDEKKAKAYTEIKPLFNGLHEKFITDSLKKSNIDWGTYLELLETRNPNTSEAEKKKWENALEKHEKFLRTRIGDLYTDTADKWKTAINTTEKPILKENGYKILTEAGILKYLKAEYPDKSDIIEEFEGFFTYFTGFNQNRENYYSVEDKSTAVAHRIV